jgi:hypothetical protein
LARQVHLTVPGKKPTMRINLAHIGFYDPDFVSQPEKALTPPTWCNLFFAYLFIMMVAALFYSTRNCKYKSLILSVYCAVMLGIGIAAEYCMSRFETTGKWNAVRAMDYFMWKGYQSLFLAFISGLFLFALLRILVPGRAKSIQKAAPRLSARMIGTTLANKRSFHRRQQISKP